MTNSTLYQKNRLFRKKWFEIKEDGLAIRDKQLLSSNKYLVKFENIGIKTIRSKGGIIQLLFAALFLFVISTFCYITKVRGGSVEEYAYLLYLVIGVLVFLVYLITYKRLIYLAHNDNSNAIAFMMEKPSKAELEDFIQALKEKRNAYLVGKYGRISTLLSYEQQQQNMQWLIKVEALSHEEYILKLEELNSLFKSHPGTFDFHLS